MDHNVKIKNPILIAALSVLAVASVVIAFKCQVPNERPNVAGSITTQWITVTIDGYPLAMDFYNAGNWYDTVTLNTEFDTEISVGNFSGYTMTVNGVPVESNQSVNIRLETLEWETGIEFSVTELATGNIRTNYVRTLPSNCYNIQAISSDSEHGFYYFNLNDHIYKMDTSGQIVFFKGVQGADMAGGGMDFKRTEVDGSVYYSYLTAYTPVEHPALTGVGYGRMCAIVMDEYYKEIDRVNCLVSGVNVPENYPLENHQFTILGEKHYLLSSYIGRRVTNFPDNIPHSVLGARVVAAVLQEVKNGTVIWQWDSTEFPELYSMSTDGNDYFNESVLWSDYAHFNAVVVDPSDGNFLCSFRHLNAILKLDRTSGDILWVLGGVQDEFSLTEEQEFSHQHDVKVTPDGGITIFNNGNIDTTNVDGYTSVMKFILDEETKTVSLFEEYSIENSFSPYMGGATELSQGHYVISWGGRNTGLPIFSEVDFNTGEVLFELVCPQEWSTYRVYKADN